MLVNEEKLFKKIKKQQAIRAQIELEGRRDKEPNLLNVSRAIDEYVCLHKLMLYCRYLSYAKFVNPSFVAYSKKDFLFLDIVLQQMAHLGFSNPLLLVYDKIRLLFEAIDNESQEDELIFNQLSVIIDDVEEVLGDEEKTEVYSYLTNYCTYKINTRHSHFFKHFLTFGARMLDIKLLNSRRKDRFLPPTIFRNIVTAALRLKDDPAFFVKLSGQLSYLQKANCSISNGVEWTSRFIRQFKDRLSSPDADSYYRYSMALLFFHQRQFGKAYRILGNPHRQQGMFINLNTRLLHLIILYEVFNIRPTILENDEVDIAKVLEAFRGLIRDDLTRKQQLNPQYLAIYKNFEQLFKRLYRINLKYRGITRKPIGFVRQMKRLQTDVELAVIPFKDWMLEQLGLLQAE